MTESRPYREDPAAAAILRRLMDSDTAEVRIEDMREHYWAKRFNGARRVAGN